MRESSGAQVGSDLDPDSVPRRASGVREHRVVDDLLLYLEEEGEGVSLNLTAQAVWELCDGNHTAQQIGEELAPLTDIPESALRGQIEVTIRALAKAGVLTFEPAPSVL